MSTPLMANPSFTGRPGQFDASIMLACVAWANEHPNESITHYFTDQQRVLSDTDKDGYVDPDDCSDVLAYNAYLYNRGSLTYDDWVTAGRPKYDT
jgi:hypothetical protein